MLEVDDKLISAWLEQVRAGDWPEISRGKMIELLRLALRATDPCEWRCDTVDDCWDTSCGNMFTLAEGTPDENMMEFCPYCGGPLVQEDQP